MSAPKVPERILPKKEKKLEGEKQEWTSPAIMPQQILRDRWRVPAVSKTPSQLCRCGGVAAFSTADLPISPLLDYPGPGREFPCTTAFRGRLD